MYCYAIMALVSVAEGKYAHGVAAMAMTAAHRACDDRVWQLAYAAMAIMCALEGRYIGTLGFAASMAHADAPAATLLAMHYGLVGIDAEEEPVIGRMAVGLAAANYALI